MAVSYSGIGTVTRPVPYSLYHTAAHHHAGTSSGTGHIERETVS
uniref:Uncharacterized protein n=1 Tax=Anguilla anguilla TaxID=7936 RepID=A0A0E9RXZ8_ANGAN